MIHTPGNGGFTTSRGRVERQIPHSDFLQGVSPPRRNSLPHSYLISQLGPDKEPNPETDSVYPPKLQNFVKFRAKTLDKRTQIEYTRTQ
jgi:hypothetical protein